MKYNNKNQNDSIENDELNIKSHLNTSLDLSGISVSEDLINRTLAAIKEQSENSPEEAKTSSQELGKKVIPWNRYVRGFAGVAAAVIIVAVGYNIIQQAPFGAKKSADMVRPELTASSQENSTMMATTEEAPAAESSTSDSSTTAKDEEDVQFTITAETSDAQLKADVSEENKDASDNSAEAGNGQTDSSVEEEQPEVYGTEGEASDGTVSTRKFATVAGTTNDTTTYSFRDIFISSPEQAEYIKITDNRNDTQVILTNLDDIEEFYIIMDSHQFTSTGNDSMIDSNYTIEMNSSALETLYTMFVGNNLTVRCTQGENTVENIYYVVDDTTFKQELEEFFVEHSE